MAGLLTVPAFSKGASEILGRIPKAKDLTDKKSGRLMLSLLKRMRRKPRQNIANPTARPKFYATEGDTDANVQYITKMAETPGGRGVMGKIKAFPHQTWKFISKQLNPINSKGYMTEDQFALFQQSQASQRATLQRAESLAYRLNETIRRTAAGQTPEEFLQAGWNEVKRSDEAVEEIAKRGEEIAGTITRALNGESQTIREAAMKALNPELRAMTREARNLIDAMTNELVDNTTITKELRDTLVGNMGQYMRRTYKLFTDATYKPDETVFIEAQEELAQRIVKSRAKDWVNIKDMRTAREQAAGILEKILDDNQVADYAAFTNRMMQINDSVLRRRKKTLTPAMRRFLGEETDPAMNLVHTIEGMADMVYKGRFYEAMHTLGDGKWLFPGGRPNGVFKTTIEGTNSLLDGMVTTPEMAKVLSGMQSSSARLINGDLFRGYYWLKGVSQKAKTVYSHPTHMKNIVGGFGFRAANGYAPFSPHSRKAFEIVANQIRNGDDEALRRTYDELLDLGIINTNTRVGEFRQLINDGMGNPKKLYDRVATSLDLAASDKSRSLSLWAQAPDKVYMGTDDYFKINTYFDYVDTLKKAYPSTSEEVLKREAAAVTRNLIPNYDLVPNGIKELRKLPISNFAGFSSEVIRTSWNILQQGFREVSSGNTVMIERGLNRLIGLTTMVGGGVGLGADISQRLAGFDTPESRRNRPGIVRHLSQIPFRHLSLGIGI
jgi:hypothetical protein